MPDTLYTFLEEQVKQRNTQEELCLAKPDPLMIASAYPDEYNALVCALYAYGNVQAIVKFLGQLDWSVLEDESKIPEKLASSYYRFQSALDTQS